jgi:hypothetical protein
MKGKKTKVSKEPIGIVIAGTPTPPMATVFTAYVWGPAPTAADDDSSAS